MILVKTSRVLISEIWKVKNKMTQDHADMNIYKYYLSINVHNESSVLKRNKKKYYFVLYLKILSIGKQSQKSLDLELKKSPNRQNISLEIFVTELLHIPLQCL